MKKKVFLMLSLAALLVTLTVVNVSAGMQVSDAEWNGTSPTITFTYGTDGVASYVHENRFYENRACFTVYSRVSYSAWYQGLTNINDPYCIPVKVKYVITYSNISTPTVDSFDYTARNPVSYRTVNIPYEANGIATAINVHHEVNCNDNPDYDSNYSSVHVSQTCSYN